MGDVNPPSRLLFGLYLDIAFRVLYRPTHNFRCRRVKYRPVHNMRLAKFSRRLSLCKTYIVRRTIRLPGESLFRFSLYNRRWGWNGRKSFGSVIRAQYYRQKSFYRWGDENPDVFRTHIFDGARQRVEMY